MTFGGSGDTAGLADSEMPRRQRRATVHAAAGAVGLVALGLSLIHPVATATADTPAPIFSVGTVDSSDAEFALAPGGYAKYSTQFPHDVQYTVGTSTPGADWSYIQPGPKDSWAGSKVHPFEITYNLPAVPATDPELVISYLDTQTPSPPAVDVSSNGTDVETLQTIPGGATGYLSTAPLVASTLAAKIPVSTLKAGTNTLTIENTSGSWSVYDGVELSPDVVVPPTLPVSSLTYTAPTGSAGGLDNPMGVATNDNGTVYVSNSADNVVASIAAGTTTIVAGSYEDSGETGDGGPAASATLDQPSGLAVDQGGDLFIADTEDNVVREVTSDGTIKDVAGNGTAGSSGNGGPATAAELDNPQSVAVDGNGDLFIADTDNDVVREVTPDGIIKDVAGNGTSGYSGDGGPATSAELTAPSGVAVDSSGNLYIADAGNNVIRRVSTAGVITTVAGDYATDQANDGLGGDSGDGGPAVDAQLHDPQGVALDRSGDLFIADTYNNAIREVTPAGIISTVVHTTINTPYAVAADNSTGDLYIADTSNNAVRQVSGLPVPGAAAPGPVAPSSGPNPETPESPLAVALPLVAIGLGGGAFALKRRRTRHLA